MFLVYNDNKSTNFWCFKINYNNVPALSLLKDKAGNKSIMTKITKAQLVSTLAEESGLSKKEVTNFFDTFNEVVYKEVKRNEECLIPGFGKMIKQKRKARKGRNPATGEEIQIPAKTVAKLKLSKAAKDAIS